MASLAAGVSDSTASTSVPSRASTSWKATRASPSSRADRRRRRRGRLQTLLVAGAGTALAALSLFNAQSRLPGSPFAAANGSHLPPGAPPAAFLGPVASRQALNPRSSPELGKPPMGSFVWRPLHLETPLEARSGILASGPIASSASPRRVRAATTVAAAAAADWSETWRRAKTLAKTAKGLWTNLLDSSTANWTPPPRRYATRLQEQQAWWITLAVLAAFLTLAYFNGQRENRNESERIRGEVQRLVRLKKEFDEQEASEDLSDDSIAAALREAQERMQQEEDERTEEET